MQTKSKIVELSGSKYHIRKLPPEEGSFIFMRMLGISMRQAADTPAPKQPQQPQQKTEAKELVVETKISGEMRVRALSFAVFSGSAIDFADFKLIQSACLRACAIVVEHAGNPFPMPVVADTGEWTKEGEELSGNVGLVMRLTTEVLIFCFSDFFEDGGAGF